MKSEKDEKSRENWEMNPNVSRITGVICGYRVEEIEDKLMQQIRCLDKLVDELARGKASKYGCRCCQTVN